MTTRTHGPIATITLNRPDHLNTIVPPMTDELERAVDSAVRDGAVKVIVLRGAGRAFCAGFDLGHGFDHWDDHLTNDGRWDAGKEYTFTTAPTTGWVPKFMSLWHSPKPVIAQVQGWCLGGGSEMALCADIVITSDDAQIGTPNSRMFGCHHAGMWVHRLGLAHAKELALTGRALSGVEATRLGLVIDAFPFTQLEETVYSLAERLTSIPSSQLTAMKLIVNQTYENMGLNSTRLLGSVLDGMLRNTPEALAWIESAEREASRPPSPAATARSTTTRRASAPTRRTWCPPTLRSAIGRGEKACTSQLCGQPRRQALVDQETSGAVPQRQLTFRHGRGRIEQRLMDVLGDDLWEGHADLLDGHPGRNHLQRPGDRHATADFHELVVASPPHGLDRADLQP